MSVTFKNGIIYAQSMHHKGLTESKEDEKLIKYYTFNSKDLNNQLYSNFMSNTPNPEEMHGFNLKKADNAFDSLASTNNAKLYMGIGFNPAEYDSKIIHFPAFASTSSYSNVAHKFGTKHILEIDTNGFKHSSIQHLSQYGMEYTEPEFEHVLPRHTTVMLTGDPVEKASEYGTTRLHWPAKIVTQGIEQYATQEQQSNPANRLALRNRSKDDNHYIVMNAKTDDTVEDVIGSGNLHTKTINHIMKSGKPHLYVKLLSHVKLPDNHISTILQSNIGDNDIRYHLNKQDKLSDENAELALKRNIIPQKGISDRLFDKYLPKMSEEDLKQYAQRAVLTDKQYKHFDENREYGRGLIDNDNLSMDQIKHRADNNKFIGHGNLYKMLHDKTFPKLKTKIPFTVNVNDLNDVSPEHLKKARENTFEFKIRDTTGIDSLLSPHTDMPDLVAKSFKVNPQKFDFNQPTEKHILLTSVNNISSEGLHNISMTALNGQHHVIAMNALYHKNLKPEHAKDIVDGLVAKKSQYATQAMNYYKRKFE